ncbi:hypothetical protein [Alterisphingorhabdus coralli]|uniref:Uncharacterized protein n=1 Tax=Alterisphingorhabdus coralli TaxID=3071408 RepID=A0AA97HZN5_9SPHN|nr:hypothetical protein [Parasphingorhabdus sp. SCSIO 66989]WOE74914.1 hypothetical protein RB602_13905 [Parasphingorhabdus sp. SCSIO 66989]
MTVGLVAPALASPDQEYACEPMGDASPLVILVGTMPGRALVQRNPSGEGGSTRLETVMLFDQSPPVAVDQDPATYPKPYYQSRDDYDGAGVRFTLTDDDSGILSDGTMETSCRLTGKPLSHPDDILALRHAMTGQWSGELAYRDYQNDRWFSIPMKVETGGLKTARTFITLAEFDDGASGKVRTSSMAMLADKGETEYFTQYRPGRKPDSYANNLQVVSATDLTHWTIVATREGVDDNRPALIKETSVRDGDTLTTLKEVHFIDNPDADDWVVRNRITLTWLGASF